MEKELINAKYVTRLDWEWAETHINTVDQI